MNATFPTSFFLNMAHPRRPEVDPYWLQDLGGYVAAQMWSDTVKVYFYFFFYIFSFFSFFCGLVERGCEQRVSVLVNASRVMQCDAFDVTVTHIITARVCVYA